MKDKIIYALGFFDGVHLGHQALLENCRQLQSGCLAGAVTFDTHPQELTLGQAPALINQKTDRDSLLRQFSAEVVTCLPFDARLRAMNWEDFLRMLLEDHGAAGFVCGDDFRFGYRGEGNAQRLTEFCLRRALPCRVVPEQTIDGIRVSSTHIRRLIEAGDVEKAKKFLGHPHILSGQVMPGRQLGRTIGVPTANIPIPAGVVVPKWGVYACICRVDGKQYMAVTNIGSRPTVGGHQLRSESWLLDFSGDLYGKSITLEFHKFLRPEQKFESLEALQAQIHRDAALTRRILS